MSGVAVIRSLLAGNTDVIAVVPPARIMAGFLPMGSALPAISVVQISSVPALTLAMTEVPRMHADRVQVTVLVKSTGATPQGSGYPGQRALLALVLAACPNQRGLIKGITVDSILADIEGPDLEDAEVGMYAGSRDFIVKWLK